MRHLLPFLLCSAILLAAAFVGCGGSRPAAPAKPDTTSARRDSGTVARVSSPDSVGVASPIATDTSAARRAEEPRTAVVAATALPKLWDFGSKTCPPCLVMNRFLTPMAADYKDKVEVRSIDADQDERLAEQFGISSVPTQVFLDAQGKELRRHVGFYPRDSIEVSFKELGFPVVAGAALPGQYPGTGST